MSSSHLSGMDAIKEETRLPWQRKRTTTGHTMSHCEITAVNAGRFELERLFSHLRVGQSFFLSVWLITWLLFILPFAAIPLNMQQRSCNQTENTVVTSCVPLPKIILQLSLFRPRSLKAFRFPSLYHWLYLWKKQEEKERFYLLLFCFWGITIMTSYSDQNLRRERVPLGAHYIAQVDRFHSHFTFELCLPDVSFFFLCWDRLLWPMAYGIVCSSFRNNFRWPLGIESLALSLVEYRRFLLTQSFLGRIYFMVFGAKKRRRKKCD